MKKGIQHYDIFNYLELFKCNYGTSLGRFRAKISVTDHR